MSLVQIHHLEQWGRTVDARDRLGRLVATLARSTLPLGAIRFIRFLHGTATQLPRWDGLIDAAIGNEFVPEGASVWELGSGADDIAKIRGDFKKRLDTTVPDGWARSDTVYIALTLSKLQDAEGE